MLNLKNSYKNVYKNNPFLSLWILKNDLMVEIKKDKDIITYRNVRNL